MFRLGAIRIVGGSPVTPRFYLQIPEKPTRSALLALRDIISQGQVQEYIIDLPNDHDESFERRQDMLKYLNDLIKTTPRQQPGITP